MIRRKIGLVLLLLLFVTGPVCLAADGGDNALAAVALYIDTSGHYVPGMDMLNKALNEVIRFKVNALFLGSEVLCGNEVLRDLERCNVSNPSETNVDSLASFSNGRHVNYVVLFAVSPFDISLNVKTYSRAENNFLIDKTVTRPEGTDALSSIDVLSSMIGDEITQVLQSIRG